MKKWFVVLAVVGIVAATGCSKKPENVVLKTGTPEYQLAKDIAKTLPALDPDKNMVLVSSEAFKITIGEVVQSLRDNFGNRVDQLKSLPLDQLRTVFLQNAVQIGERKMLYDSAKKAKTVVTEDEINKALNAQYAQAGGEAKFSEILKTNGLSLDRIKLTLTEGLTVQRYLENLFAKELKVSEEDLKKAYDEAKVQGNKHETASVQHILLMTQGKSEVEKTTIRKKIEDILNKAKRGEDFAGLAKKYSEDPGSKDNGGLYKDFKRGQMVKPFEDAAFSVPIGEISPVVETTFGYHIIKVVDRKIPSFEEVKASLESDVKQNRWNNAVKAHLSGMKDKVKFKVETL